MQRNWFGMPNEKWLMQAALKEILLDGAKVGAIAVIPIDILLFTIAAVSK